MCQPGGAGSSGEEGLSGVLRAASAGGSSGSAVGRCSETGEEAMASIEGGGGQAKAMEKKLPVEKKIELGEEREKGKPESFKAGQNSSN